MDTLQRFSGVGRCPKCLSTPTNAKFCDRDCSRGESRDKDSRSHGGQFTSDLPPLGSEQPPDHLHRICRTCGFEWLEQTADARPEGDDKACAFCLRLKTECNSMVPLVPFLEGVNGNICGDCLGNLGGALSSVQPRHESTAADTAKTH